MGAPLGNGQRIDASGTASSKAKVAGYSILQADSMAEAEEPLKGNPHLGWEDVHLLIFNKLINRSFRFPKPIVA